MKRLGQVLKDANGHVIKPMSAREVRKKCKQWKKEKEESGEESERERVLNLFAVQQNNYEKYKRDWEIAEKQRQKTEEQRKTTSKRGRTRAGTCASSFG